MPLGSIILEGIIATKLQISFLWVTKFKINPGDKTYKVLAILAGNSKQKKNAEPNINDLKL